LPEGILFFLEYIPPVKKEGDFLCPPRKTPKKGLFGKRTPKKPFAPALLKSPQPLGMKPLK